MAETTTGETWRSLRHELDRLDLVTLATSGQKQTLSTLELPEPPKFADFTTT